MFLLTFWHSYAKIRLLNRGAEEQKYLLRSGNGIAASTTRLGKGISAEAQILFRLALGIRENTRVTVTVREVLFTFNRVFRQEFCTHGGGLSPVFYFI